MRIKKLLKLPLIIVFCLTVIVVTLAFKNLTPTAVEVTAINFIGEATLPTGTDFKNTELGGLSGITYDAQKQLYYAISDDRSVKSAARFYTFKINLNGDSFQKGDIEPVAVITLKDKNGKTFPAGTIESRRNCIK